MKLHSGRGLALTLTTSLAVAAVPLLAFPATAAGTLSLVGTSADGAAFDVDEHAAGDITVQLTDSGTGPADADDAQDLQYSWTVTPFGAAPVRFPATGTDAVATDVAGEFEVPLPAGAPSGTYVLTAGLPAGGAGAAVADAEVLTVTVGEADVVLDDADPLQATAGTDHPLRGTVALEDGTPLPGRTVDLALQRGTDGSDQVADAGFVPELPDTALVTARPATTGTDGTFSVVLSDPAETPQGSELGGTVTADVTSAAVGAGLGVDFVTNEPPTGSTVVLDAIGSSKPGLAQVGTATVTVPDDTFGADVDATPDPLEGQLVTLTLDHGFFTTGDQEPGAVVGAPAGNLVDLGTTLTAVTDAAGEVPFRVAVERDRGFDGDGLLTATVTAAAGSVTATETADWDSADPLNGRLTIDLSPASEQLAPVNPAVIGDRTYYDVTARDQFGNPVDGDHPVDIGYGGNLDDADYSDEGQAAVTSDLDTRGDIWVVSFEPSEITVTGTWRDAPTTLYTSTAGASGPGTADAVGSNVAKFYAIDFDRSRFTLTPSVKVRSTVGTTVAETVKVTDQLGRPVRGFDVSFFRFGPDAGTGEVREDLVTNARGEATYRFVGTRGGRARITAVVTDGVRSRTLTHQAAFAQVIRPALTGKGTGKRPDVLKVKAARTAAGAKVTLYRVVGASRRVVRTGKLNAKGLVSFTVKDKNGKKATTYQAVVAATATTFAGESPKRKVR